MLSSQYFVFDAYGTLLKTSSDSEEIKKRSNGKAERIQELWRSRQLQYTWLRSLMNHWVDFNKVTEDALDFALKYYEMEDPILRESLLCIYQSPSVFDDVTPFLSKLKKEGTKIAILSNGTPDLLKMSSDHVGISLYLNAILSASQAKVFKPDPSVYQLVCDEFSCEPKEVTFFSSNTWDIAGAARFGFKTVWVNRMGDPFEELGVEPDSIVKGLG